MASSFRILGKAPDAASLTLRLLKSSRIPFLANNFFYGFNMVLNTICRYGFFMAWKMIYDFFMVSIWFWIWSGKWFMICLWFWIWSFYGFEYDFLWFWIWFVYGFGRNLLQNPFLWWKKLLGKGNLTKIVKKIVNATKVPRNSFLAKNSRNLRFFYDFFTILVRFPFPRSFFPPQKLILKQIPTKIVKKS